MTEPAARPFLDMILAHPADDAPRLVYADWLEEHGDTARAEFIRVQCERAGLPEWDGRRVRLMLREQALLAQHEPTWLAELPVIKRVLWGHFRRGFMAEAEFANFGVLGANAAECWAATPIESVGVRWPRQREGVERIAPIAGLRELTIIRPMVDIDDVGRLADAPLLGTVRTFTVREGNLGLDGFRRLIASPHLRDLAALRLPHNSIGNGGINSLFEARHLAALTELDLSEAGSYGRYGEDPIIDATGMEWLATWPGLARLRSLSLSGNDARRDGLRSLLQSPFVVGLKHLAMRGNSLTRQAMAEFGVARPGLQLDSLDLGENLVRDSGAGHLAKAACLGELKVLRLDRCEMRSAAGARKLAKAPFLRTLRVLNVDHNTIGPDGLAALLAANPPELHTLSIMNNDLGDAGAAVLAESPASDVLRDVNLAFNNLCDRSAYALAESKHLQNLLVLRVSENPITRLAGAALKNWPLGQRLAVLELPTGVWTEAGAWAEANNGDIPF